MQIIKYPDGTSYAQLNNSDPHFTFRLNSYEDVIHLLQIIEVFNYQKITPTITIPNLIDAQADRRFDKNQSFGLKIICKLLNSVNAKYRIFHPHNSEVVESLLDNVEIIDNSEFITNVLNTIHYDKHRDKNGVLNDSHFNEKISDYLILTASDAGGFKPLMKLCDKIKWKGEVASASKSREYKDGKTVLTQLLANNDFNGKDILIVDDICIFGGTFKGLAKLLRERNCGKLYLAVSHMTVQNLGSDPVTNYFDKVFTTNSKGFNYNLNNIEVVKMFV